MPDAEALLTPQLNPIHRFHPKTFLLEVQTATTKATGLLVGPANLTCNVLHPQAIRDFPQIDAGGRKETAEQSPNDALRGELNGNGKAS